MRRKIKISFLLTTLAILMFSCAKEEPFLANDSDGSPDIALRGEPVSEQQLISRLPGEFGNYSNSYVVSHSENDVPEALRVLSGTVGGNPSTIRMYGSDFVNHASRLSSYLQGRGLIQGSGSDFRNFNLSQSTEVGISLLQSTGYGTIALANVSSNSSLNLAAATGDDESYIRALQITANDVAGWEIYDARLRIATVMMSVNGRYAGLVEATNVAGTQDLVDLAGQIASGLASLE